MRMLSALRKSLEEQVVSQYDVRCEAFLNAGRNSQVDLQALIKVEFVTIHMNSR